VTGREGREREQCRVARREEKDWGTAGKVERKLKK